MSKCRIKLPSGWRPNAERVKIFQIGVLFLEFWKEMSIDLEKKRGFLYGNGKRTKRCFEKNDTNPK